MKDWKFGNLKRWTDLLVVTLKDYYDISNGVSKPSTLLHLPFSADSMVINNEVTKNGSEEEVSSLRQQENEILNFRDRGVTKKPSRMAPRKCSTKISRGKKPMVVCNKGVSSPKAPPLLPMGMRQKIELEMGGLNLQWINKKDLTETDCKSSQSRLNLPHQIDACLSEPERWFLRESTENKMDVLVIDPMSRVWDMVLCYWPTTSRYVFITNWNGFVRENGATPNVHTAQIWSFRKGDDNQRLCFAVNIAIRDPQGGGASCSNAGALPSSVS